MTDLRRVVSSRDTLYLLIAAVTQLFLAADAFLSHVSSGGMIAREWIPVVFGLAAAGVLLLAGVVSIFHFGAATVLAVPTYLASMAVGILGAVFHWRYLWEPTEPVAEALVGTGQIYVPPVLAPLAFTLVGVLGLSAVLREVPPGSGALRVLPGRTLRMPYPKHRAYLLLVDVGILIAVVSATLDHAHARFEDPWMWAATAAGIFAAAAVFAYALRDDPSDGDRVSVLLALGLLAAAGLVGEGFHLWGDLQLGQGAFVVEKFVRGAPPLAPLLYVYMASLGLVAVLPLREGLAFAGRLPARDG